ncbi:MAG: peptidase M16, partial [Pseudomonadota bacterium]
AEPAYAETLANYANNYETIATANSDHFKFDSLNNESQPAKHQMWLTQTQVNFCAKAFPSVHATHPDAPGLTVLAHFLRNGVLHKTIREQGGAYGGGASQDSQLGVFKFYSYRDPRLLKTFADFDASIDWMLTEEHSQSALEEAIFTVISAIDKPSSPAGEARKHHAQLLSGTSDEQKRAFRNGVLSMTIGELKRLTEVYLSSDSALSAASTAVISSEAYLTEHEFNCEAHGYQIHHV